MVFSIRLAFFGILTTFVIVMYMIVWTHQGYELKEERKLVPPGNTINRRDLSAPVKLVILGYLRGGTTFFSEIFNRNGNAFFWFEPLAVHYLHKYGVHVDPIHIFNGVRDSPIRMTHEDENEVMETLDDLLNCRYPTSAVPVDYLSHRFMLTGSRSVWKTGYPRCVKKSMNMTSIRNCYRKLPRCSAPSSNCTSILAALRNNKGNVSKVESISRSKWKVQAFRNWYKCMKKVYESQNIKACLKRTFLVERCKETGIRVTKLIRLSMETIQRLAENHPDWLFLYYYEAFAKEPVRKAKGVYRLLGRTLPDSIVKEIRKMSQTAHNGNNMNTNRKDPFRVANAWQKNMTIHEAKQIKLYCSDVYEALGYSISI
ncbi:carbohydrate sulfotransferase 3-like isoform X2 [Tubulanus polymorphus]|uniref:carbohydrate sulfotransferase 3-like isoform X2 n=1 Tax=Tubulanus polymorphus TaxID=672921 RepID=UPI003DA414DD